MLSWISVIVNSLVALGTLILAYMAYKSINESRRAKLSEIHTSELKNLIKSWKDQLPSVPAPDNPIMSHPNPIKHQIEEHRLFPDIQNHTSSDLDVIKTWEEFKKQLDGYAEKRYELFKAIRDISLKKTKLDYDPDLSEKKDGISKYFSRTIYEQLVLWAISKEKKYNNTLQHKINESGGEYIVHLVRWSGSPLFKVSKKELIDETIKVYNDLKDNPDKLLELFREKVDSILRLKESLEDMHGRLAQMLDKLLSIPVYYQICEHINRALHPSSQGFFF